jgi:hypothetical protein
MASFNFKMMHIHQYTLLMCKPSINLAIQRRKKISFAHIQVEEENCVRRGKVNKTLFYPTETLCGEDHMKSIRIVDLKGGRALVILSKRVRSM